MVGTRFILDEEKILKNPEYSLEGMYATIDEAARLSNMEKIDKNYYVCKVEKNDLAFLGRFVCTYMANFDWFTKYLKEWVWIDDDGEDDIIEALKESGEGVWE